MTGFQFLNPILAAWGRYTVLYGVPYALKRRVNALNLCRDTLAFLWRVILGGFSDHHLKRCDDALAHLWVMYRFEYGVGNRILYEVAAERSAAFWAAVVVIRFAALSSSRGSDEPPAALSAIHLAAERIGLLSVNNAVLVAASVENACNLVLFLA
nr:hypothetical protein [uncultured Senegalimassilia sp.]